MERNKPATKQQNSTRLPDAINVSITNNFTQIPNNLLRRPDMSGKAKAILCLLLSNQEGWTSYMTSLQQMMKEGLDALHSGLQELEQMGYLLRVRYREKTTKKWVGSFWVYTNSPNDFNLEKPLKQLDAQGFEPAFKNTNNPENPHMENPDVDNRHMANPGLIIPINKKTNLNNNSPTDKSSEKSSQNDLPFNPSNKEENNLSNSPNNKPSIKERSEIYIGTAKLLAKIIQSNRNIAFSTAQINQWANEIRKLVEINEVKHKRVRKALRWYEKNVGGEYIPVIESGTSLREKFMKLEAAIERERNGKNRSNKTTHRGAAPIPDKYPDYDYVIGE